MSRPEMVIAKSIVTYIKKHKETAIWNISGWNVNRNMSQSKQWVDWSVGQTGHFLGWVKRVQLTRGPSLFDEPSTWQ